MPTLNDRLSEWLREEASDATADLFAPYFRPSLRELGCSPTGPCSEEQWEIIREKLEEMLSKLGFTLSDMEQAAEETRRARKKGWTFREWMRHVFRRHLPEGKVEELIESAETQIEAAEDANDLDGPLQPEEALTYRRILDGHGGGASLAASQELSGGLPTN